MPFGFVLTWCFAFQFCATYVMRTALRHLRKESLLGWHRASIFVWVVTVAVMIGVSSFGEVAPVTSEGVVQLSPMFAALFVSFNLATASFRFAMHIRIRMMRVQEDEQREARQEKLKHFR